MEDKIWDRNGTLPYLWGCSSKKWAFGSLFNVLELSLSPAFITFRKILTWPQWYHVLKGKIKLYFLANSLRVVSNFGARKEQSKYTHTRETSLALEVEFRKCARFARFLVSCQNYRLQTVYLTNKGPSFSKTCAVVSKVKASDRPWRDGGKHGILSGCKPT